MFPAREMSHRPDLIKFLALLHVLLLSHAHARYFLIRVDRDAAATSSSSSSGHGADQLMKGYKAGTFRTGQGDKGNSNMGSGESLEDSDTPSEDEEEECEEEEDEDDNDDNNNMIQEGPESLSGTENRTPLSNDDEDDEPQTKGSSPYRMWVGDQSRPGANGQAFRSKIQKEPESSSGTESRTPLGTGQTEAEQPETKGSSPYRMSVGDQPANKTGPFRVKFNGHTIPTSPGEKFVAKMKKEKKALAQTDKSKLNTMEAKKKAFGQQMGRQRRVGNLLKNRQGPGVGAMSLSDMGSTQSQNRRQSRPAAGALGNGNQRQPGPNAMPNNGMTLGDNGQHPTKSVVSKPTRQGLAKSAISMPMMHPGWAKAAISKPMQQGLAKSAISKPMQPGSAKPAISMPMQPGSAIAARQFTSLSHIQPTQKESFAPFRMSVGDRSSPRANSETFRSMIQEGPESLSGMESRNPLGSGQMETDQPNTETKRQPDQSPMHNNGMKWGDNGWQPKNSGPKTISKQMQPGSAMAARQFTSLSHIQPTQKESFAPFRMSVGDRPTPRANSETFRSMIQEGPESLSGTESREPLGGGQIETDQPNTKGILSDGGQWWTNTTGTYRVKLKGITIPTSPGEKAAAQINKTLAQGGTSKTEENKSNNKDQQEPKGKDSDNSKANENTLTLFRKEKSHPNQGNSSKGTPHETGDVSGPDPKANGKPEMPGSSDFKSLFSLLSTLVTSKSNGNPEERESARYRTGMVRNQKGSGLPE